MSADHPFKDCQQPMSSLCCGGGGDCHEPGCRIPREYHPPSQRDLEEENEELRRKLAAHREHCRRVHGCQEGSE